MKDNFDLRKYLVENSLGAYSKVKPVNEAQVDVHPGSEGYGTKKVDLVTDEGMEYTLEVLAIDEDEVKIKSGVDENGQNLSPDQIRELQLTYENDIAQAVHDMYGGDIEISRAVEKGMPIPETAGEVSEALSYEYIERMDGLANRRLLAMFTDAVDSLAEDFKKEGFEYSDVREYLTMLLKERLG